MLILAFDCSSPAGSVVVLDDSQLLARVSLDPAQRSARTLAPAIASAMQAAGKEMPQVQLVATTVGPGSFTGLRVAVTMAKTLAYSLGCDVIGLGTLNVIAAQAVSAVPEGASGVIHAVVDAQRKELFVSRYQRQEDATLPPRRLAGPTILSAEAWLKTLQTGDIVTGSGLARWKDKLPPGVLLAPQELHEPDAATVGRLAFRESQAGRRDDLWTLRPLYIRPSYAEDWCGIL